jgi:hypothetical protein
VLSQRFAIPPSPAEPAPAPTRQRSAKPGQEPDLVRRTYYYSRDVADALAETVNRIHHQSQGRVPKHRILDAIITAGITHLDETPAE